MKGATQTWSAENILGSLSVQAPTSHGSTKEYHGPIPMELDRVYYPFGKGDKGKGDKGKGGKGKGDKGKSHYGRGRGYVKGKGGRKRKGYGRGKGGKIAKGRGGKSVRQVEGQGYGDGSGKGGQGVVCGKTGHIASECWSAPSNKGKGKAGKGKVRNVQETGEEEWSNEGQQSSSLSQARTAPAAKGNEQVTRVVSTPMPILEEIMKMKISWLWQVCLQKPHRTGH